jgi:hypothetical protein
LTAGQRIDAGRSEKIAARKSFSQAARKSRDENLIAAYASMAECRFVDAKAAAVLSFIGALNRIFDANVQ